MDDAPAGWIAKHIADVRVVGEPYAGTGMFPAVMWPSNSDLTLYLATIHGYPTVGDFWKFVAWLRKGHVSGVMRPKKAKKGKRDVHTWRADIVQAIRNHGNWDHCYEGPVIIRAAFLMPRPLSMGDGIRRPFVRIEWRDADNCWKCAGDAMKDAGAIVDDGLIYDLHVTQWYAASGEEPGLELSWWGLVAKVEPSLFD